jgi:TatD DNase family protein
MGETDTPCLAPSAPEEPTKEPAFVLHTARRAAEIRGEVPDDFAARTLENTRRFYGKMDVR